MKAKEIRTATVEGFTAKVKELLSENLVGFTTEAEGNALEFRLVNGQVFHLKVEEMQKL